MNVTVRELISHVRTLPVRFRALNSEKINEELRSLLHHRITQLRDIPIEPTAYNTLVNTPEFSRFVFVIPTAFLAGVTMVSLSPPTTLPLIFEKMIPYHIKTISISCAFYTFTDLAMHVIGRPTRVSHHRLRKSGFMLLSLASLLGSTAVLSLSDYDPHKGYKATLGLLALSSVPALFLPMQSWIRVWRLAFLGFGVLSTISADQKLRYLESNWDEIVFSS
jgi:hypothetical protein